MTVTDTSKPAMKPTSNYFLDQELMKLVPGYLNDATETPEPVLCETEGNWPSWIEGSLVRTGGGRYTIPLSEDGSKPPAIMQHFFDVLGMLHKFDISNGKIRYNSRHIAEGVVRKAKKEGRVVNTLSFGSDPNTLLTETQDPCQALLGKQQAMFIPKGHLQPDELNLNVTVRRGFSLPENDNPYSKPEAANPATDELVVQTEGPYFQVCDSKSLEPKRILRYSEVDPNLKGMGTCAHPVKDRTKGEIYNYLVTERGELTIFALDIKTKPSKLIWHTVLPSVPCYCHSLAMTEKYVVFVRNPITLDPADMQNKSFLDAFTYNSDCPVFFFVLERASGKHIATYNCPNFMFFHSVNAYDFVDEETGKENICVDLVSYDGSESQIVPFREYSLSNVINPIKPFEQSYLIRYELNDVLGPKAAASTKVFVNEQTTEVPRAYVRQAIDQHIELPRINTSFSCDSSYRYAYGVGGTGKPSPGTRIPIGRQGNGVKFVELAFFASITKTDWETGTSISWHPPNGESCPCEPIFAENPAKRWEDDGCILTIVMDRDGKHSILVCLDAKDLKEIARAHLPQTFSLAPHGTFVDGVSMFPSAL
ncbi:unnamed protein product [Kuraishia capsulata CBS 1993]|uniref:Uncharacterized protein n=1 Tax=Kuraishia capsulata CBS 1993 TaxID=1382522 RepID=W6MJU1_9ASCO|nr:uncharacterized protein KUCA_T00002229001 [Kuraishia capsulata CBS 1993]CDK26258.1 unnamed protein product [Kuraishia capsulata CBS 1993]